MLFRLTVAAFAMAAAVAQAQLATPDPDWKEAEAPAPPALQLDKLIPIEIPARLCATGWTRPR